MKKILSMLVIFVSIIVLTGCVNPLKKAVNGTEIAPMNSVKENTKANTATGTKKKADLNNNSDYYFIVSGKKFSAGDKISNISSVGLKQDSRVVDHKISKNTYLIGGGNIYNSSDVRVLSVTPYNPSDEEITAKDAVIGGFEVGEYEYDIIKDDVLNLNISVVGGIKLGSSYEELLSVFGETDNTYNSESLGYTQYTYKSDKVYRSFEFTVDKNNKVSRIKWQNLEFAR